MEKSLGEFLALALVVLLLFMGGYIIASMRRRPVASGFPAGERRNILLAEIFKMKEAGKSYDEQMKYLRQQGIDKSVAAALLTDAERKFNREHGVTSEAMLE
ncbi:hypothetical protein HUU05_06805 [candidate division KSB1 bacterium]|nr:hypothetical protein [candidate division KSB1 bacterium]